jgi:hypothetical protein
MSRFRWFVKAVEGLLGMAAATLLATVLAPAGARADDSATPDPTVLDVLDSVLAESGGPSAVPSTPAPQPTSPGAGPAVPVGPGEVSLPG